MLETYTLTINYPSSEPHEQIRRSALNNLNVSLSVMKQGEQSTISTTTSFQKELVTLLRNLCILTQTLGPLPERRYLTMQITYYDELTPTNYEPPGFLPKDFDIDLIFNEPSMKHSFGTASSNHHRYTLECGEF